MSEFEKEIYTDDIRNISVTIGEDEWYPLQARVQLTTATTPDYVTMIISPQGRVLEELDAPPSFTAKNGGLLGKTFTLDIDTELSVGDRESEETRLFTGGLANLSSKGDGVWEAIAWDESHQVFAGVTDPDAETITENEGNFLNSELDIPSSVEEPKRRQTEIVNPELALVDFPNISFDTAAATKIKAQKLAKVIIEQSPIDDSKAVTNFSSGNRGIKVGEQPDGTPIFGGKNIELSFQNNEIKVSDALETIRNSTNSEWWFDRFGVFHIGAVETGGNPINSYNLRFITDTSAGKTTPMWKGVQVIGSGVVSEDGWDRSNLNSSTRAISVAQLKDDGKVDTEELAEPVFTYRNLEIQTQAEADNVAKEIVNKLQDQQAEGKVTTIGFPEVRPLDAIQLPNTEDQPMGPDARYAVTKVVHKINPSDGFLTDIHVGGLTRESSTVYNEELQQIAAENLIASNTIEGLASGSGF